MRWDFPYISPRLCHETRNNTSFHPYAFSQELEEDRVISHSQSRSISECRFIDARSSFSVCMRIHKIIMYRTRLVRTTYDVLLSVFQICSSHRRGLGNSHCLSVYEGESIHALSLLDKIWVLDETTYFRASMVVNSYISCVTTIRAFLGSR